MGQTSVQPGDRFGRLVVTRILPKSTKYQKVRVQAKCDCGADKDYQLSNLQSGTSTSCGCYRIERVRAAVTKHGSRLDNNELTPTYSAWRSMVNNCTCLSAGGWKNYGAKGITVCPQWRGERGFEQFLADMGERPSEDHVLSRRDKKGDFTTENTYWATKRESYRNTSRTTLYTVGHRTQCLVDWAKEHGIPKNTLHYRVVTKGMSMRDALDVGRGRSGKLLT